MGGGMYDSVLYSFIYGETVMKYTITLRNEEGMTVVFKCENETRGKAIQYINEHYQPNIKYLISVGYEITNVIER